jgi:thiol-disulfide isomerase/thioredoxin
MNPGTSQTRLVILLACAAAFGLLSTWWLHQAPDAHGPTALDGLLSSQSKTPHPATISQGALMAISLPDPSGKPHTFAEWQGRPLVINFWATWCLPCVEELPTLAKFSRQSKFADAAVIGIAMDAPKDVDAFLKSHTLPYTILQESQGIADDLSGRLGNPAGSLPFSAIVNRKGIVVETRLGPWKEGELESRIAPLLTAD